MSGETNTTEVIDDSGKPAPKVTPQLKERSDERMSKLGQAFQRKSGPVVKISADSETTEVNKTSKESPKSETSEAKASTKDEHTSEGSSSGSESKDKDVRDEKEGKDKVPDVVKLQPGGLAMHDEFDRVVLAW